jgi:hypothetical protein
MLEIYTALTQVLSAKTSVETKMIANYHNSKIVRRTRFVIERFNNGYCSRIFVNTERVIGTGQEVGQHGMYVNVSGGDLQKHRSHHRA